MKRLSIGVCSLSLLLGFTSTARADLVCIDRLVGGDLTASRAALRGRVADWDRTSELVRSGEVGRDDRTARAGGDDRSDDEARVAPATDVAVQAAVQRFATSERDVPEILRALLKLEESPARRHAAEHREEARRRLRSGHKHGHDHEHGIIGGSQPGPALQVGPDVAATPEPGTLLLLVTGLAIVGVGLSSRHRRNEARVA
jgi:hypothetical protein